MKARLAIFLCLVGCHFAFAENSTDQEPPAADTKTWSVAFNAGELVAFGAGSALVGVGYLPLHFEANYYLSPYWQLNLGLVFRYDWGSFIGPEFIAMAGLRYSFSGTGLYGSFFSLKAGPGYVTGSHNPPPGHYSAFEFAIQPEFGYSSQLGSSGYFQLGGGVLCIIANQQAGGWNTLGYLVHVFVPIVDVSLGFTF